MTLPTLVKTWQLNVNNTIAATGNGNTVAAALMIVIKNAMKGFGSSPWTVSGSSNASGSTLSPVGSAAMDGVDRWSINGDLTGGTNGRHAWIVLRQTGIASNYEVCFDLLSSQIYAVNCFVSPSAGFTGGTATARPTATDEINPTLSFWSDGNDAQHQAHIWQSTDGQCTRVIAWRNSQICTFFLFDKPQNPTTNWTNPSLSMVYGSSPSGFAITYANLLGSSTGVGRSSTASLVMQMTVEGDSSGNIMPSFTSIGTVVNDFDSNWPIFPMGICSKTVTGRGRLGNIFDLWWRPTSVADGDTFPNDSNNRQFIAMGPLILPWTGTSTTALIT